MIDSRATSSEFFELAYLGSASSVCPYLNDREARWLHFDGRIVSHMYRELMDLGFRRSGAHVYRPACPACDACKVIRVPVDSFHRTKEQRRIWNRGVNLFEVRVAAAEFSEEKLELQRHYLAHQHGQPDYELPDADSYRAFLVDTCLGDATQELQLWLDGKLVGLGVFDVLTDALSSVNFFFHPGVARWSPGTFSALAEIEIARELGKRYYYLGYYIADCRTMSYKAKFRPNQIKGCDDQWPDAPVAPDSMPSQSDAGPAFNDGPTSPSPSPRVP